MRNLKYKEKGKKIEKIYEIRKNEKNLIFMKT